MPNTIIALKKSSTPSATPADLANGELAINFADGKLFYKHANGTIAAIEGTGTGASDSFGTVNAAGTLIVADTSGDILTLEAGSGITITGDAINDKITIAATGGSVNVGPAYDQANTARTHANAAHLTANAAFAKANAALANTSDVWFNGNLNIGSGTSNVYLGDSIIFANLGSSTSNSYSGFIINQTWNNASQIFSGLTINVASNAASSSSMLFDVKQNNASTFYVRRYTGTQGEIGINSNGGIWNIRVAGNLVDLVGSLNNHDVALPGARFYRSGVGFGFQVGNTSGSILFSGAQEASDVLGQRRSTNPQTYRLYGTYTDASNYERLRLSANSSGHYIIGEEAGTGSARPLYLGANNATAATIDASGNFGIGTTTPSYKLEVAGSFAAQTKSFVINHPTKPDMKLCYGSLEGPENGVYIRGRSKKKTITLPEYWSELVDEDSITVQLTPIGKHQELYVKSVDVEKIMIGGGRTVEYFYTVFAERKDVDKLVVEY